MVNINFKLILVLFFIITCTACSEEEEDPCEGMKSGNLPIMTFDNLFINDTINCWLKEEGIGEFDIFGNLYFRIDDQAQFDTLVECNCDLPNLNFGDYTLLMGKKRVAGNGTLELQKIYLNCDFPQVNYTANILVDTIGVKFSEFQYHAAIPKLPYGIEINYYFSMHY